MSVCRLDYAPLKIAILPIIFTEGLQSDVLDEVIICMDCHRLMQKEYLIVVLF